MKIVFILPGGGHSGGVRCTVIAANHLLDRGHKVRIFYGKEPGAVLRNTFNRLVYNSHSNWLKDFRGPLIEYRDIVQCKFCPDEIVVSVGMWCSAQLGRLNDMCNPKLQYIHGLTPWMPQVMDKALSLPLPKIAVSSQVAEGIKAYHNGNSLTIIHNGIDQAEYYPSVCETYRDGVGTIYSSHPAKDPETVLGALRKLREELPDVPQYVFGTGSRPRGILKSNYKRYPSLEEARYRYSRSMVWILASRSEGFPAPVLEAMACGCAVVATDCGGPGDIIIDGGNGFLVDVGDVEQIVDRVKLLLNNADLRRRFVERSKKTIERFTWDSSIDKLEAVLRSLNGASH